MWVFMLQIRLNEREQWGQEKGLSPVWVRICLWTETFCRMVLLQIGQANSSGPSLIGTFWKKNVGKFEEFSIKTK